MQVNTDKEQKQKQNLMRFGKINLIKELIGASI
jgi:hypothetical protein